MFISGKPSHGFAQHEQYAGVMLLAKCLKEGMTDYDTVVYKHGDWPKPEVLETPMPSSSSATAAAGTWRFPIWKN